MSTTGGGKYTAESFVFSGNKCTEVADLPQRLRVGAHISEDDEDVLLTLISQVLCRGQG